MRPKYQTRANRAEEQVLAMLKSESNIQKPWSLVSYNLENRTLQTTAPEASIIFNHAASLRPGYEQKERTVLVPNLFIKLSGTDEAFLTFKNSQELQKRSNCFVYQSFQSFPEPALEECYYERFLDDGLVQKEEFLSSDAFKYSFLRREYQELYVDKVNEILSCKQEFFIGQGLNLSSNEILANLFQISESFLQAFHHFDFQLQPPSVIISNKGKEKPSIRQALTLILLNLLGFDIIIQSPEGYADIENILNPDVYCLFYGDGMHYVKRNNRWIYRLRYLAAGAVVLAGLLTSGVLKPLLVTEAAPPAVQYPQPSASNTYKEPDPLINQNNSVKPSDDPIADKSFVGEPGITEPSTGKPEQPSASTDNQPDKSENKALVIKDEFLEAGIRKILNRETGDIHANEISRIGSLRFIGPYAGGPDWIFLNGYSPNAYYDVNNIEHFEEGEISDLSSLVQIPNINQLEISFQKKLDLESLKGASIPRLTLIHDNLSDISVLTSIKNLRFLNLNSNNISDISALSALPLNSLEIRCNNISNIEPLTDMVWLENLSLEENPIKDISPLRNLTNLYWLDILGVYVEDFSFLKNMPKLRNLNVENTGLTDLSIIKDLTNLNYLFLSNNNISDISSLANLKQLQHLDISMTNIRDISVLKELPSLRTVNMFGVKLDDESILNELKNIEIRR